MITYVFITQMLRNNWQTLDSVYPRAYIFLLKYIAIVRKEDYRDKGMTRFFI